MQAGFCWYREGICSRRWLGLGDALLSTQAVSVFSLQLLGASPSKAIIGSPEPLPTPAFPITISTLLKGDIETAASNMRI